MSDENRGQARLFDALTTKGTAFTAEERHSLGLLGLLPTVVKTLAEQVDHCWHEFSTRRDDLDKHIYLRALQDRNETLFYRVLREHIPETLPIVYTPTVGEACQRFSEIYRRPRGLFVSYADRDCLDEVIRNRPHRDVDVIVVTDGQRILGLGDQGIGGMGIPIGKLSLYTLIGGIDPARTLPIVLDVGTDNVELLDDPQYLGWRHRRIDDDDYYAFIDKFVAAVHEQLPDVLLQWEDFATVHAQPILTSYRDKLLTFNDDIQGTAAVALGALHGAAKVAGRPLSQQQVVMLGAGSAGIGVLEMVRQEMVTEGLTEQAALERIWVVDVMGLLTDDRTDLTVAQRKFAQPAGRVADWGLPGAAQLADVVHHVDVGVLLGLSTAAGAFTEDIVREMAGKTDRPIIFPLSNPTSRSEAHPAELDHWTDGRALIATGSPFAPRASQRRRTTDRPMQQRLHLPRDGAGRDRRASDPGDRRDDAGRGGDAGRRVARPLRPGPTAASRLARRARRGDAHRPRRRRPSRRGRRRPQTQRRRTHPTDYAGALGPGIPGALNLPSTRDRLVHLPVRAQRDHLAVVVGLVGEHTLGGGLVVARRDQDVPDVGFLVAALVGVAEDELDFGRGRDGLVPEGRDRVAAPVALALGVQRRRPDGVFDDGVVGEHRKPRFFVPGDDRLARAPAGLVGWVLSHRRHSPASGRCLLIATLCIVVGAVTRFPSRACRS